MAINGECFCGAIKYQIEGELHDARSCHCSRCRKAFSAQASAYALVKPGEFSWLRGENLLTLYIGEQGFGLQFCSKCGSTLVGVYQKEVHGVTLGCINGDPNIKLSRHIYVDSKASWELIADGVPQFKEQAS
ncbi:GFA family protein [Agarivorans sp. B2Z047]|uniref:GFA family protein n=1 Tax=Agarivorans sp. B2Z047 TaxID=2652721 RepID=UPI00128E7AA0|nr:GFA family protein [Agarivorans sp. B2Z047]MPW30959.1 GFA family protein [Agarivorans sp. B2Z047]UQN40815.1 GFA family protein [Agarivorans sp. B2Z047]